MGGIGVGGTDVGVGVLHAAAKTTIKTRPTIA
jgi:hypothetical protein